MKRKIKLLQTTNTEKISERELRNGSTLLRNRRCWQGLFGILKKRLLTEKSPCSEMSLKTKKRRLSHSNKQTDLISRSVHKKGFRH